MKNKSIGRSISIIHRLSRVFFQKNLKSGSIGPGQIPILKYIAAYPQCSQRQLIDWFRLDRGSVSSLVSGLEKNRWIVRKKNPHDGRQPLLILTEKGEKLLPVLNSVMARWTEGLLEECSAYEKTMLFKLLHRLELKAEELTRGANETKKQK